jgi:hypothetical protein
MAGKALAKFISDWELLNTAIQPHLTDMPFLSEKAKALDTLIAQAKAMDAKQQDLRGAAQETVRQRKNLVKQGKTIQGSLAASLRANLGFENQTLLGFGIKPRRPRKKKATKDPAPPPVASAVQEEGEVSAAK